MLISKKAAALALGFFAALSAVTVAQNPPPGVQTPRSASDDTLVVDDATVDWIEKSDVAALHEGVIERMELRVGMPARRGKPIGYLHREIAELTVAKAKIAASSIGEQRKAEAQLELALSVIATNSVLNKRIKGAVSREEQQKAEAEAKVAEAMKVEAQEKQQLNKAELDLALESLNEHTILAPFDGVIIEEKKHIGESVRANEAVVTLGNLDKLRVYVFVPLNYTFRVKEGQLVEFQVKLQGTQGDRLPIETKKFRGKITSVSAEVQPIAETAVRLYAEFDNRDHELWPGLKGTLTIYLNQEAPPAAVGARTAPNGLER